MLRGDLDVVLEAFIRVLSAFFSEIFDRPKSGQSQRESWYFPNENEEVFLEENKRLFKDLEALQMRFRAAHALRKRVAFWLYLSFVFAPAIVFLIMQPSIDGQAVRGSYVVLGLSFILSFFLVAILQYWLTSPRREYVKNYKTIFLPHLVKLYGDFSYRHADFYGGGGLLGSLYDYFFQKPEDNPRKALLIESKIVPGHRDYYADDLFEGVYRGVKVSFGDATLRSNSRQGESISKTVFQGLIIDLDLGSTVFTGHTAVLHNKTWFLDFSKQCPAGLKRIKVPAPEFERAFVAYGTDQVEARYLLDPAMMERLLAIYNEFSGQGMAVAFYRNRVLILISTLYNLFEPDGLYTPAGCHHSILRVKKEFEYVLSLIDRLKLYDPQRGS